MKINNKSNKGFTLVETLVAISIFTVSLIGIMSVLASSIADTTYAKQKMTATYLAQEGIEYIRNMRDSAVLFQLDVNGKPNWSGFKSTLSPCTSDNPCGFGKSSYNISYNTYYNILPYNVVNCSSSYSCKLFISSDGLYDRNNTSGTDSGFTRTIWMTKADGSSISVNAGVDDAGDEVRIYSKVSWTMGSGPQSVTFSENLFNWVE